MKLRIALLARRFCVLSILLLLFGFPVMAQNSSGEFQAFLRKHIRFSDADLLAMRQGKVITRSLKTNYRKEVAAFGVVRLNAPKEVFLEKFRDIVTFKKTEAVPQVGKFSTPPRLEDLKALTFDPGDIESIRNCRVGRCDVKLPACAIERFHNEIMWSAPDYRERVNAVARNMLVEYLKAYLEEGDAALIEYRDQKNAVRLANEFSSLLQESAYLSEYFQEFERYLGEFPKAQLANVENFVYWSEERYGFKPVVSLTHVTIYKMARGREMEVVIASKQLYASHYFDCSLGLTVFITVDGDPAISGSYLLYLNRSRIDALQGWLSSIKRSIVSSRIRSGLAKGLRLAKQRIEANTHRP